MLHQSTCDVSITCCTFQNNSATGVIFDGPQGDVSITCCTFQNNSATGGGVVIFDGPQGDVSITCCTFQNNSATGSGAVVYARSFALSTCILSSFECKEDTYSSWLCYSSGHPSFSLARAEVVLAVL